ncbi:MAG: SGNH/GDSL hydrolase family protein [Bacteroidota bacterium]|nr:SGNH/GDSL hydrolase family protein [Bacteroidota bacterium]
MIAEKAYLEAVKFFFTTDLATACTMMNRNVCFRRLPIALLLLTGFHLNGWTQQVTPTPEQTEQQRRAEERFHTDWANLKRYEGENKALQPLKGGEKRIVFMGNSITEAWKRTDSAFFAGRPYINRGISGQTTPQMLVRFRPDVLDLKPAVVVILAGINDIAQNTGPMTLEQTFGNIVSMAELAKANKIAVVLCSVLPAFDFPWRPGLQPAEKVVKLNAMLKAYAVKNNLVYVDYFSAMADERNGLKADLGYDGVHPTLAGYRVMAPLVERGIAAALKK